MDDDRLQAHIFHQDDVLHDLALEFLIDHGVTAIFDDDRLAAEALDMRQGLHQNVGPFDQALQFDIIGIGRHDHGKHPSRWVSRAICPAGHTPA